MTDKTQFEKSFNLSGMKVYAGDMLDNNQYSIDSREKAQSHEWLYHCTLKDNFLNMVKSREMWLSNLKIVNDKEEVERIDLPEYKDSYFVGSFTYDPDMTEADWLEYGGKNGVLWAVKQSYFKPDIYLLDEEGRHLPDDSYHIYKDYQKALNVSLMLQEDKCYHISDFGFYQIIYDDELKKNIVGNSSILINGRVVEGRSISPEVAGIIKSTHGMCKGKNGATYEKNWTSEKEVRLKVCLVHPRWKSDRENCQESNSFFSKIAVPFSDAAFESVRLRFALGFENCQAFKQKLHEYLPESQIYIF